ITGTTGNGGYDKPGVAPKLVPQTQRDKVEGVKGAAAL
ncbi:MAG: rod shape-determining protein MreC, partial [Megasphaera micronuciformis]|nr:rod shape-determining protein MreC [Megasphaera micronuciformis]